MPKVAATLVLLVGFGLAACEEGRRASGSSGHDDATSRGGASVGRGAGHDDSLLAGHAPVELSPERVQLFGIRTEPVSKEALTLEVRTVGVVRTDETRESHVHVKWEGWIQEFFVSYVGQQVEQGARLFSVYSPDLVTAQQELLIALARAHAAEAGRPEEREPSTALLETARTKLRLFDVPDDAIARIEQEGRILRTLSVRAPRSGTVIEKMAVPGMYVEPSMDLYTIADLSRIWVLADLYEYETPLVRVGQTATFTPVGAGGLAPDLAAKVAFVYPTVDRLTRTVKIRLELDNEEGRLRPGAYGTVRFQIPLEPAPIAPADSVIDTGTRQLVFVRVGEGRFEPRPVRLGVRAAGRVQILEGLEGGEEVVTRAQFLLDSESRLRAASERGGGSRHGAHP